VVDSGVELDGWLEEGAEMAGTVLGTGGGVVPSPSSTDIEMRSPADVQRRSELRIKKRSATSSSSKLVLA
jgi:hypothetical protein